LTVKKSDFVYITPKKEEPEKEKELLIKCKKHSNRKIEYFCSQAQRFVCQECMFNDGITKETAF